LQHCGEQEVGGRRRVDRERVERALFGAGRRKYVDLGEVVQHRADARVVADLQHVESTRVVGRLLHLLSPAERVQGLIAAHIPSQLDWRRPAVHQHEALVPMEHVLDGLPGGAHRGETGPVDGLNDGTTAPEHLEDILPVARASSFTGFPAPVWSLWRRRG